MTETAERVEDRLADFTRDKRILLLSLMATVIGALSALVAKALVWLIAVITNLTFYQRFSSDFVSPANHRLGIFVIFAPIIGGLIIGLMARYGSERIRGHGIPEALEAILFGRSRMDVKVAVLKPLSSAISIGSGGPFGAEGPIIMTGGAFGSLIAQFFHLTAAERKTLLVSGAAAGMSATFAAPVASVLLAVELLLFEWKPRSMIPVALAAATAAAARRYIMGMGPLFPVTPHPAFIGPAGLAGCVAAGILAGALSGVLTLAVYAAEDSFAKLPIHWMWWPAIGGLVIGIGGLICPQALGVGYDIIGAELQGTIAIKLMLLILVVKSIIWSVSLGSGTSGGVLAPLLMMGGALGGLEGMVLPNEGAGFWALVSMGAILGGTMRSPFTGVVFVLELTHDVNMLLPLLVAVTLAHGFTVLFLRRSILTEKVARRGFHLSREYAVDPLEILFAKEVMHPDVTVLPATASSDVLRTALQIDPKKGPQRLFPVVDESGRMVGVVTRVDLQRIVDGGNGSEELVKVIRATPTVAHPDEPLRVIVHRMAHTGLTRFPVIERGNGQHFLGLIALDDLLRARALNLEAERRRERLFKFETFLPFGRRTTV